MLCRRCKEKNRFEGREKWYLGHKIDNYSTQKFSKNHKALCLCKTMPVVSYPTGNLYRIVLYNNLWVQENGTYILSNKENFKDYRSQVWLNPSILHACPSVFENICTTYDTISYKILEIECEQLAAVWALRLSAVRLTMRALHALIPPQIKHILKFLKWPLEYTNDMTVSANNACISIVFHNSNWSLGDIARKIRLCQPMTLV